MSIYYILFVNISTTFAIFILSVKSNLVGKPKSIGGVLTFKSSDCKGFLNIGSEFP